MSKENPSLVMAGPLAIWDQEGGYASPSIQIGGNDVGDSLEELIQRHNLPMTSGYQGKLAGYWILTLVRVAKKPPIWANESAERVLSTSEAPDCDNTSSEVLPDIDDQNLTD